MEPLASAGSTDSIYARRSKLPYLLGALVLGGGLLYGVLTLRGDDAEPVVAEQASPQASTAAVTYEPPTAATKAAAEVADAAVEPAELVEANPAVEPPEPPPEVPEVAEDSAKGKVKGKGKGKRPTHKPKNNRPKNDTKVSGAEQQALFQKTTKLYQSVARSLDRLEQQRGKAAVASLRDDYNAISFSRLMRDKTMQPIYYQSLMRLQAKIIARRKKQ
jgi:hypothetical protein